MEDYINIEDFSDIDVKMTNQPYWNQFKSPEWVLEKVKEAAEDKKRFNCMENLVGPTIAYLKAKDVKRKERTLKNLYKDIAANLRKATNKTVGYCPGQQHAVQYGEMSLAIMENHCFVFSNRKPVLQVSIRLVNLWVHLLPNMLRL